MKTKNILFAGLLILSLSNQAQNLTSKPSSFNIRFFDEGTGIKIIPENITIVQRGDVKINLRFNKKQISKNGTILIPIDNGTYDITVEAQGFKPMSSYFKLGNQSLKVNFNLVPIVPTKELSSNYIQPLHRPDAMIVVGFVVDDYSGNPLDSVLIYSEDKKAKTYSKKNGFYQLVLPLPESEKTAAARGTVYFKKKNYTTEVRQNFDIFPNGDIIIPMRLTKGTGVNRVEIIQKRIAERTVISKKTEPSKKN